MGNVFVAVSGCPGSVSDSLVTGAGVQGTASGSVATLPAPRGSEATNRPPDPRYCRRLPTRRARPAGHRA